MTAARAPGPSRPAAVLRDRREDILLAWERAVRASAEAPRLDGPSLRDHVTEILDRVAAILSPASAVDGDPREHGRTRASQGVGIVPVLAELGVLRGVVVDFWAQAEALEAQAVRALDRVVDEAAMEAAHRITETYDAFFRGVDAISRASLESRDADELLRRLLEAIVRTSRAVDAAAVLLREGDRLLLRASVGFAERAAPPAALRVGEGFAGRIAAEARPLAVEDATTDPLGAGDVLLAEGMRVLYGVPLVHEGSLMGVAEMGSRRGAGLSPEDRRLFESIASRAALALARQLARDRDRRHREELAILSRLSRDLGERLDLDVRLRHAVESTVPGFADWCAIVLVEDGDVRRVALHAADPAHARAARERLERHAIDRASPAGLGRVLRDGTPQHVADLEAPFPEGGVGREEAELLRSLGLRSYLAVPLAVPSGIIGAACFGLGASGRRFDERSLELALEIGRRLAVAVDNARLFERARREAMLREHVLAVVSHDLRNPLSTVLMGAGRVEAKAPAGPEGDDLRRLAAGMRRSARRMERLIGDLMDVAAIQAGRLSVSPEARAPGDLVREMSEAMAPLADERGVALALEAAPELPRVLADRDRIHQVLANLVSNALDVTPPGGRVGLRAEARDGAVRFSVSDTGPGVEPAEMEQLFEPYRRGFAPGYKGTGLGLAIARGIVTAHGGRIGVESAPGAGATFWFTLPAAGEGGRRGGGAGAKGMPRPLTP